MKIVIDTNVFISSFFFKGNPRKVFDRVINRLDNLYISDYILQEIMNIMSGKFYTEKHIVDDYIKIIKNFSIKIFHNDLIENVCRDVNDNEILKCGLEGEVDFIITGDNDLLVLKEYKNIKIVKVKDYLDFVNDFITK